MTDGVSGPPDDDQRGEEDSSPWARAVALATRARKLCTDRRLRRYTLLAFILLVLASYKLTFTSHIFDTHPDGGYYTDIARHIRDGDGLVTNLCLLHKGCTTFPVPADIYPLWPLVYGLAAKVSPLGLLGTGKWLATVLYFVALVLGYAWATTLFPRPLLPGVLPSFDAGHLFVLMLGLNKEFFAYTTFPYTEALAFTVVLAALWRGAKLWPNPSWRSGLELGVWLGLAFLARKQMLVLAMAAAPMLVGAIVVLREHRRRYATMAACTAVAFGVVVAPHVIHLSRVVPNFGFTQVLRWDQTRFSDVLAPVPIIQEVDGLWPYLVDRAQGFEVAFALEGKTSYVDHYYLFQYGLVLALPLLIVIAVRQARPTSIRQAWAWIARPDSLHALWSLTFAIGAFLALHTMHMEPLAASEWVFGGRWALPCVFLFFGAFVLLLRRPSGPWRAAATILISASIYLGVTTVKAETERVEGRKDRGPSALAQWLNRRQAQRGKLIVAYRRPQVIMIDTPEVGYHWYHNNTSLRDVERMVTHLGADYLVAPRGRFGFERDRRAFNASFRLVKKIGRTRIYEPTSALLEQRVAPSRGATP